MKLAAVTAHRNNGHGCQKVGINVYKIASNSEVAGTNIQQLMFVSSTIRDLLQHVTSATACISLKLR
jgi:hypothetical protein